MSGDANEIRGKIRGITYLPTCNSNLKLKVVYTPIGRLYNNGMEYTQVTIALTLMPAKVPWAVSLAVSRLRWIFQVGGYGWPYTMTRSGPKTFLELPTFHHFFFFLHHSSSSSSLSLSLLDFFPLSIPLPSYFIAKVSGSRPAPFPCSLYIFSLCLDLTDTSRSHFTIH